MTFTIDPVAHAALRTALMPVVSITHQDVRGIWKIFGFGALTRGPVDWPIQNPAELFAVARALDCTVDLDINCLARALRFLRPPAQGPLLFVNVTPETIQSGGFTQFLLEAVGPSKRSQLVLELTEGDLEDTIRIGRVLAGLRSGGFRVAIDDVGGAGSDIARLRALGPVDYVKTASEIVQHVWPKDPIQAIYLVRSIKAVADQYHAKVIVEGIEARAWSLVGQLDAEGISLGQGFLFGQPQIVLPPLMEMGQEALTGIWDRRSDYEDPQALVY